MAFPVASPCPSGVGTSSLATSLGLLFPRGMEHALIFSCHSLLGQFSSQAQLEAPGRQRKGFASPQRGRSLPPGALPAAVLAPHGSVAVLHLLQILVSPSLL